MSYILEVISEISGWRWKLTYNAVDDIVQVSNIERVFSNKPPVHAYAFDRNAACLVNPIVGQG